MTILKILKYALYVLMLAALFSLAGCDRHEPIVRYYSHNIINQIKYP